jgi:Mg-chelatase subunit ChlD
MDAAKKVRLGSGRRSLVKTSSAQGRYVKAVFPKGDFHDIALDATLRAAAPRQFGREKNGMALSVEESDIRVKIREKRIGNTILFLVDASGSMGRTAGGRGEGRRLLSAQRRLSEKGQGRSDSLPQKVGGADTRHNEER